jgi:hypothetical protein
MFGSHFKHVWITFQARFKKQHAVLPSFKIHVCQSHLKQFCSMFGSYFKHVSRTNMQCYPVSKIAILEHVGITFQACLDHISSTFQARLDHISSTFQEQTCCVTQFQNSCVPITFKAILEHVWIIFQARFKSKHAVLPSFKIHECRSNLKQFWSMFGSHFKHIWITFQARLKHFWIAFQERTCCVTQFQNSCANHNKTQYKPIK